MVQLASPHCFDHVYDGGAATTNTYCGLHILLYVVAFLNFLMFLIFLIFNWKAQALHRCCLGFTKSTNMILMLTCVSQFMFSMDYFFYIEETFWKILLIVGLEFIKFTIFFYVCFFFAKKATHLLPHRQKWLRGLLIYMAVATVIYVTLLGFYTIELDNLQVQMLCRSKLFLWLTVPNVVFTLIFI